MHRLRPVSDGQQSSVLLASFQDFESDMQLCRNDKLERQSIFCANLQCLGLLTSHIVQWLIHSKKHSRRRGLWKWYVGFIGVHAHYSFTCTGCYLSKSDQ
ncbi:hypothetical protein AFLA_006595 [Aspergillus flavus NRRL3357]|nr:hypothetical protein AFLA_006595 [Aspergillus flavus NRRL3357]